jgi:hypothetical protein
MPGAADKKAIYDGSNFNGWLRFANLPFLP